MNASKPSATIEITVLASPTARHTHETALSVPQGTSVSQALRLVGLASGTDGNALAPPFVHAGVWGRKVALSQVLREGDRVEVYRALTVDPKVARRERFAKQGTRGTGLFSLKGKKAA